MQTPVGYELIDGRFFPKNWFEIVFNPSFPYRLFHTIVAFYVTTAFVVAAAAAYLIRGGRFVEEGRVMFSMTLWLLSVLVPLQILIGDLHGLNTLKHQPAKIAAIEAHWETQARAPLNLFAIPDEVNETNRYAVQIPALGSLILAHDANAVIKGLKDWPPQDRPPVAIPFFAFRIMVGIGVIMLGVVVASWWLRFKGRLFESRWLMWACQMVAPLGFVAVVAGWTTTEVGRQPWTVYGLLRTADSVSPSLTGTDVMISLAGYIAAYLIMFPAGLLIMVRLVRRGPVDSVTDDSPVESGRPNLSAPLAANFFWEARTMNALVLDTVPIWTVILGFGVFLYVLLDGFDLGVGMLFGLAPDTPSRNLVMNSIAPIWDGNETWLVLGGLALLAAFPLAFAIIIPAVYFPDPGHVARPGLPRRCIRVPVSRRASTRPSGTMDLSTDPRSRRSRRVSCSGRSSRASKLKAGRSPADRLTSSRRSLSSPAWRSCSATDCSAPAGSSSRRRESCRLGRAVTAAGA